MKQLAIVDTGPLVAAINRKDVHNKWALSALSQCSATLITCEAVLTEAFFLLRRMPEGEERLIALLSRKAIEVPFQYEEHAQEVRSLMGRFCDVPMSYADACLVRMSEVFDGAVVLTLDRDFLVYRRHARQAVPILAPFK